MYSHRSLQWLITNQPHRDEPGPLLSWLLREKGLNVPSIQEMGRYALEEQSDSNPRQVNERLHNTQEGYTLVACMQSPARHCVQVYSHMFKNVLIFRYKYGSDLVV